MLLKILLGLILSMLLSACGGQSGGLAPSKESVNTPNPIADISYESNIKFAETQNTGNGWEVTLDTTDPVESVALGNGWNVEVRYE